MRQIVKENDAFRRIYYRIQMLRARAQSDETKIIDYLTASGPQTFVEFGFHPIQFNCISLAKKPTWQGLLVDGNSRQISDAIAILPSRLKIVRKFLTLENIDFIRRAFQKIWRSFHSRP
jgi:hypothetical protein